MKVEYDKYSLIVEGKREFILSGAIHYYRLPSQALWADRIRKMKEAGLNAVDVYFAWNYHSPAEGEYDFSGIRDVDALMDIIQGEGMYLIARPGPYICSEVDAGGFPGWLLTKKDVILRCREPGRAVYCAEYMKYVHQWYEQIIPRIAKRSNLILFQIENEYNLVPVRGALKVASDYFRRRNPEALFQIMGSDVFKFLMLKAMPLFSREAGRKHRPNRYMVELYRMARELGVGAPIFHNDIMSCSERQLDVDIMAIDDYAINSFSTDWRGKRNTFLSIDIIEDGHDAYGRKEPIFIAEFQGGWFDTWGGRGYEHNRRMLGTDQLDIATKSALAQRATLINYFMFCGGTTYGYLGSPDVYTSYDMCAPVTEDGRKSERWYAVRWVADLIRELGDDFLVTEPDDSVRVYEKDVFCRARKSGERRYVFIRNNGKTEKTVRLSITGQEFTLAPVEMKLLVFSLDNKVGAGFKPAPTCEIGAYQPQERTADAAVLPALPELKDWRFALIDNVHKSDYDDSHWENIPFGGNMDIDSLGFHYGYVWYRGRYRGKLNQIQIDARHCYSIFVNGNLIGSEDGYRNAIGNGDDFGFIREFAVPASVQGREWNVIVVLVESLGHNKDFECDARNPRGILDLRTYGAHVEWRARGGLIDGERGLCPVLPKEAFPAEEKCASVSLPHEWGSHHGIGIYQTEFTLQLDDPMRGVGLVIGAAHEKANIYLNGHLIGRYWETRGPQKKFYLPPGILNTSGGNHLAIAVWRRTRKSGLDGVQLEFY
ncbi:MAG: beta-galactosidase [bacterium]